MMMESIGVVNIEAYLNSIRLSLSLAMTLELVLKKHHCFKDLIATQITTIRDHLEEATVSVEEMIRIKKELLDNGS